MRFDNNDSHIFCQIVGMQVTCNFARANLYSLTIVSGCYSVLCTIIFTMAVDGVSHTVYLVVLLVLSADGHLLRNTMP